MNTVKFQQFIVALLAMLICLGVAHLETLQEPIGLAPQIHRLGVSN